MNCVYYGFNRGLDGDFKPTTDSNGVLTTFCNEFIQSICNGLGYSGLNGLMANQMIDFMLDPKNGWITVDDAVAQAHANNGALVIAGKKNPTGHGHVCLIIPGILEQSNSFGKSVPKCANVGKDVFIGKRISFAFPVSMIPQYFVLGQMI